MLPVCSPPWFDMHARAAGQQLRHRAPRHPRDKSRPGDRHRSRQNPTSPSGGGRQSCNRNWSSCGTVPSERTRDSKTRRLSRIQGRGKPSRADRNRTIHYLAAGTGRVTRPTSGDARWLGAADCNANHRLFHHAPSTGLCGYRLAISGGGALWDRSGLSQRLQRAPCDHLLRITGRPARCGSIGARQSANRRSRRPWRYQWSGTAPGPGAAAAPARRPPGCSSRAAGCVRR